MNIIEAVNMLGLFGIVILMFAAVFTIWVIILALVFFVKESNIKKLGMTGAEFYDDHPAHRRKAPRVKPTVRRKT